MSYLNILNHLNSEFWTFDISWLVSSLDSIGYQCKIILPISVCMCICVFLYCYSPRIVTLLT
jgi:hypothetical protein